MTMERMIVAVATRLDEAAFYQQSATGRSLPWALGDDDRVELFASNTVGLPKLYNRVIAQGGDLEDILVFVHDDVWLLDYFIKDRLVEALHTFDIVGLAGNRRRLNGQPGWMFSDADFTPDVKKYLSGTVAHGASYPPDNVLRFGEPRQPVRSLDGLLLAMRRRTLIDNAIAFDERFDFHFYDLDLTRQAEAKRVTCGTWDIAVVHQSVGGFGGPSWERQYQAYLEKWGQ